MKRVLDSDIYQRSQPLRLAFREGQAHMIDQIKELAVLMLSQSVYHPFVDNGDFEAGQHAAISAIIDSCSAIEETIKHSDLEDNNFDA